MSQSDQSMSPEEEDKDPRARFRRLMDSAEEPVEDATVDGSLSNQSSNLVDDAREADDGEAPTQPIHLNLASSSSETAANELAASAEFPDAQIPSSDAPAEDALPKDNSSVLSPGADQNGSWFEGNATAGSPDQAQGTRPVQITPDNTDADMEQTHPVRPARLSTSLKPDQDEGSASSLEQTRPVAPESNNAASPMDQTRPVVSRHLSDRDSLSPMDQTRVVHTEPSSPDQTTRAVPIRSNSSPRPTRRDSAGRPIHDTPLPRRVSEVDEYATQVSQTVYDPARRRPSQPAPEPVSRRQQRQLNRPTQPVRVGGWKRSAGCLIRSLIVVLFLGLIAALIGGSILIFQYFAIAQQLPDVNGLRERASQFETTRILDRNGNTLYEILDPNAGRRTYVPLSKISPYLIAATIATEDKEFYNHPGFDPSAIVRALYQNYVTGGAGGGASTITQQLARTLLLSPEERVERTYQRKAREIVLAAEITRRYSKDDILELYLNENYYGNLAYGIEAASETYFGTTADALTLAQAAFLTGLPQAPSVYDIFTNRDDTLRRHKQVLVLIYQVSQEKGCIYVSTTVQPVCVSAEAAASAASEIEVYNFQRRYDTIRYPHWVNYVRSLLESQFDAQTIYRSGFSVYTTLDPGLQDEAENIVKQQVAALVDNKASDGALVAIRPSTGEILAMVGSADFYNEAISGQVNMAVAPRQPGSAIKPLTYVAAFEKGWTPSTLIWDVPTDFPPSGNPNDTNPPYHPVNYDGKFHGPVSVRTALSNSYNIPAVKTLAFVGIYDDPNIPGEDGLVAFAKRLGITTLTGDQYGLSLTLGGGEVPLLQLTSAYATFANSGRRVPPVAITRIVDHLGKTIYEYTPPPGDQVVGVEHAYLISSILSDTNARVPAFGTSPVINLPFQAAAKTGTTNDFRDNWTMGYTPDIAVGVWVGNADWTPMQNTTGLTGAAPIWAQFMQTAVQRLTGGNPSPFVRPPGVVERVVCSYSGTEPSQWCPDQRSEIFAANQLPPAKENDLWQKANIDTWTGLRVSNACANFSEEKFVINVSDPSAMKWIKESEEGRAWAQQMGFEEPITFAPARECRPEDSRPSLSFTSLSEGQTITNSPLDLYAVIDATSDFDYYRLDYGVGEEPVEWKTLVERGTNAYKQPDKFYTWDLKDIEAGVVTLRLYLHSTRDTYAEKKIHLNIQVPTPTPTATPTATTTATPTVTPSITPTPTVTPTQLPPTQTPTPPAPTPTETSTAIAVIVQTEVP